jgi:DNA-binding FrmR family transcriptional regulator
METTHTHRVPVDTSAKPDILRRIAYIEGHLNGVKRMIEEDQYCVDVLKQTYAVRRAIEKMEKLILEHHLQGCVVEGIKQGREDEVIGELIDLYEQAGK